jgi:hypothetical protein
MTQIVPLAFGIIIVMIWLVNHRLSTALILVTMSYRMESFILLFRLLYSSVKLDRTIFSVTVLSKLMWVLNS